MDKIPLMTKRLTLLQMSEFAQSVADRQRNMDGSLAGHTYAVLDEGDAAAVVQIAAALRWMAPYADSIRRMITEAQKQDG